MSTSLKVSSLSCKSVFFRSEHNAKGDHMELSFQRLEMQKWKIPTGRPQRADEKIEAICLIIMFTPRIMVIKMSKMAHIMYFLLMTAEKSVSSGKILSVNLKDLIGFFQKMVWLISFGITVRLWNKEGRNIRKTAESTKHIEILYFEGLTSS